MKLDTNIRHGSGKNRSGFQGQSSSGSLGYDRGIHFSHF